MSATAPLVSRESLAAITTVKRLSESSDLKSIPPNYAYYTDPTDTIDSDSADCQIPIIDLSLLTSADSEQSSRAVQDLDKACREWGFFMVVNHGIPEELTRGILEVAGEFFDLPEEEKPEFQPKNVLDPIRYGTSFNTAKEEVFCWRDFLKVFVHPQFHCPHKPGSLRELLLEYCERTRDIVRKLVRAISESMGLQENEMDRALDLGSTLQIFVANLYPKCPNPEMAMGIPSHSDHGLFTLLIENQVGGLQIQHQGKWINVNSLPNSILVNTGDHLEIFSNGRYKSVLHRAVVNNQKTRISVAMTNGPSPETVVSPATSLLRAQGCVPAYVPMKYKDYLLSQQSSPLKGKSVLKQVQQDSSLSSPSIGDQKPRTSFSCRDRAASASLSPAILLRRATPSDEQQVLSVLPPLLRSRHPSLATFLQHQDRLLREFEQMSEPPISIIRVLSSEARSLGPNPHHLRSFVTCSRR